MVAEDLEPGMEKLLTRLAPDRMGELEGATPESIDQIERIAGRPLPRFHQWFLARMGTSMGPFRFPSIDCSAATIISCYEEELVPVHGRYLLIGFDEDELTPLHLFYDFDYPARDDARVVKMNDLEGPVHVRFETYREMIAWGKFARFRVTPSPQWCRGVLAGAGQDVLSQLSPLLLSLHFEAPVGVPTGPYCSLFERDDAAMITRATPGTPPKLHAFTLGGKSSAVLRRVLGEIATGTSLELEVTEWAPPLAE